MKLKLSVSDMFLSHYGAWIVWAHNGGTPYVVASCTSREAQQAAYRLLSLV